MYLDSLIIGPCVHGPTYLPRNITPSEHHCFRFPFSSWSASCKIPSISSRWTCQLCPSSVCYDVLNSFIVKVSRAERQPLNVPLIAPFTIATTRLDSVQNVAIRVELTDGSVGWGEIPTLPPVTIEDQPIALEQALFACAHLKNVPPKPCNELLKEISDLLHPGKFASVRAGMEMAVVDAVCRSVGLPLWQFFGGCSNSITTDITIPICTPKEAGSLAAQYAKRGFHALKLKVGGRGLLADLDMLTSIHMEHPNCQLILDANEGYTPDEALQFLSQLHDIGITPMLLEQPVPRHDWEGLGYVCRMAKKLFGVPIAADESCRSLLDAKHIANSSLADVINIKLAKVGVIGALEVIQFAKSAGLELMIGGMIETRLAMGFAVNLAAGQGCFRFIDLDTPILLAEDPICGGYEADGPVYKLTEALGHGASVHWPDMNQ
eukprot:c22003_g1_i1 orf=224-1528(-)